MKFKNDIKFLEALNKSPIGSIFYNKEGKLIHANPAAAKITEISRLDDISSILSQYRQKLSKNGWVKFQSPPDKIGTSFSSKKHSKTSIIDWTVSITEYGFLMQIQDIEDILGTISQLPVDENKYKRLFEEDLTGDFIATPEGKVIECNPSFIDIYGFKNYDQAISSNISKFNPNEWVNLISRLKNEGKIKNYEQWHTRPDSREIHIVANVVGIFDDSDKLVEIKGYVFDDTERKIAEEALKESEEKYHRLFDEDLTGDFIATLDGKILECNPAFAEIYGFYDCEQALNWNISKFNPFDWPYIVTQLKKERKIQGFQSWQRRYDGMRIHVIANVVGIFNEFNELVQIKGYVFDDTERKKAEEELNQSKSQIHEILDSIQDGFIALNNYWNFIYVNQCAAEYFGIDSEDLIGENLWEMFSDLKGTTYEKLFHNAIEKQEIQRFEAKGIFKTDHWYDFSVYPSNEGISVFWRDTTHEKPWKKS